MNMVNILEVLPPQRDPKLPAFLVSNLFSSSFGVCTTNVAIFTLTLLSFYDLVAVGIFPPLAQVTCISSELRLARIVYGYCDWPRLLHWLAGSQ